MVQELLPLPPNGCSSLRSACSVGQVSSFQSRPLHPIPYQGSKRALARRIIEFFPANAARVVEPFAGSAAVSLAALHYGRVRSVLIGDSNEALINLWREIVHRPEILADAYSGLWHSQLGRERSFYHDVRRRFNQSGDPELFLYLLVDQQDWSDGYRDLSLMCASWVVKGQYARTASRFRWSCHARVSFPNSS